MAKKPCGGAERRDLCVLEPTGAWTLPHCGSCAQSLIQGPRSPTLEDAALPVVSGALVNLSLMAGAPGLGPRTRTSNPGTAWWSPRNWGCQSARSTAPAEGRHGRGRSPPWRREGAQPPLACLGPRPTSWDTCRVSGAEWAQLGRLCAVASHPLPWAALRIKDDASGVLQIPWGTCSIKQDFSGGLDSEAFAYSAGDLGQEEPLEKEMATHFLLLPGESHGQRVVGYSPWDCKDPDLTEGRHFHFLSL